MKEFKFKFGDIVTIQKGFYRGQSGTITDIIISWLRSPSYVLSIDTLDFHIIMKESRIALADEQVALSLSSAKKSGDDDTTST